MLLARAGGTLLLLVSLQATATAQMRADEQPDAGPLQQVVKLGAFIGGFFASTDHEFYEFGAARHDEISRLNFQLGLRAGYAPIRYAAVEVEGEWTPTRTSTGSGASILGLSAHVLGQYPLETVTPFALAGLGTMGVVSGSDALGTDADLVSYLGVGAEHRVQPRFTVRFDARIIGAPEAHTTAGSVVHGEILLGATYDFDLYSGRAQPPPVAPVAPLDSDLDGIADAADECPEEAGVAPTGCPESDADGDGINDRVDACPEQAETQNGFEDDDGCPDELPDADGDGIRGDADECPHQPEDPDGFEDEDGCPEVDNDDDGIVDDSDDCPLEPGPAQNAGCPDRDRDGDGVVDRRDNCPDEAGSPDNHGCIEEQLVAIRDQKLELHDKVFFRTNGARIRSRSRPVLDNIAAVLKAHPEIEKVRVEGHTDSQGRAAYNEELSQRRAEAVVRYLVGQGVPAEMLTAVGHGESEPIADNDTRAGRRSNRRVEFTIAGSAEGASESE